MGTSIGPSQDGVFSSLVEALTGGREDNNHGTNDGHERSAHPFHRIGEEEYHFYMEAEVPEPPLQRNDAIPPEAAMKDEEQPNKLRHYLRKVVQVPTHAIGYVMSLANRIPEVLGKMFRRETCGEPVAQSSAAKYYKYYPSFAKAMEDYLDRIGMRYEDIKNKLIEYAANLDRFMESKGKPYRVSIGRGSLLSKPAKIVYGEADMASGGGYNTYTIRINPMLEYASRSRIGAEFLAFTLFHETAHALAFACGEDTTNEGFVNAMAYNLMQKYLPNAMLTKMLGAIYEKISNIPEKVSNVISSAYKLYAPYVKETREALATMGDTIRKYVSRITGEAKRYAQSFGQSLIQYYAPSAPAYATVASASVSSYK